MAWLIRIAAGLLVKIPSRLLLVAAALCAGMFAWWHVGNLAEQRDNALQEAAQERQQRQQAERTMEVLTRFHQRKIEVLEAERADAEERARRLKDTRQRVERAEDGPVAPVLEEALKGLATNE